MNKKYIPILAVLFVLSSMVMISATVTLSAPTASSQIAGSVLFNATNSSAFDQMENCTFYGSSVNTVNTSIVALTALATNSSIGNQTIIAYVDTTKQEDGNAYLVFASCWNVTGYQENSSTVSVVVDNTVPVAPTSLVPVASSTDDDGAINFSGTVTNARTTGCSLVFSGRNPGSSSYTMSYTGTTCYYNFASIPDETFSYYIQATDGLNTTDSATTPFTVYVPTSSGFLFNNQQSQEQASSTGGVNPLLIWTIIILIIASIFYFKKK